MSGVRVLVTRPEPGAYETGARLEALGHEPVLLPLTEIRPLPVRALPDVGAVEAVAVTSANAVRHASQKLVAALSAKPCFAVGDRSAEVARGAGFSDVVSAEGDAAALASMIGGTFSAGTRIAYLCGGVRRPDFESLLTQRGIRIIPIETYDTVHKDWPADAILKALGPDPVDAALVYSLAGAEALAALARRLESAEYLAETRFFCLSARVAKALGPAAAARVTVSPEPAETALISLLGAGRAAKSFS